MNKNKLLVIISLICLSANILPTHAINDEQTLQIQHQLQEIEDQQLYTNLRLLQQQNQQDPYYSPAAVAERRRYDDQLFYWRHRLKSLRKAIANEQKKWDTVYKIEKKKWDKIYKTEKRNRASKFRLDQITAQSKVALDKVATTEKGKLGKLRTDFEKVRKEAVFSLYGVKE